MDLLYCILKNSTFLLTQQVCIRITWVGFVAHRLRKISFKSNLWQCTKMSEFRFYLFFALLSSLTYWSVKYKFSKKRKKKTQIRSGKSSSSLNVVEDYYEAIIYVKERKWLFLTLCGGINLMDSTPIYSFTNQCQYYQLRKGRI